MATKTVIRFLACTLLDALVMYCSYISGMMVMLFGCINIVSLIKQSRDVDIDALIGFVVALVAVLIELFIYLSVRRNRSRAIMLVFAFGYSFLSAMPRLYTFFVLKPERPFD